MRIRLLSVFLKTVFFHLFLFTVLAGCHRTHSKSLEVWTISLRPAFTLYMEQVIADWEKKHPGIHVEWVDLPINVIQQKLIAAMISGSPPSVVNLNTDMAFQLAEAGALLNLDQAVPPGERERYYPGLWDAVRYEGGHYAVPWYVTTQVLIYNAEIFKKAGLDPDHPPETWDELLRDAVLIKEKTGLYGWFPSIKFIQELQEHGIPVVDATGKQALFDRPPAVQRLQMYVSLFQKGTIPRETLALSKAYQMAVDFYQAGKLGILQAGPQFLNRVRDNAPSVYQVTRVAPLPKGKGGVVSAATMNLVLPRNAPFQKEAVDFALYLTDDDNELAFSKTVPVFPSRVVASHDPFFFSAQGDPLFASARKIGADELQKARELNLGLKNAKARNESIQTALENALMGRKSPYEALHEAAVTWNKLLQ